MKKYIKYLRNKYLIVSVVMLVWLLFIDDNNLIYRYHSETYLDKLEEDQHYYRNRIEEMETRRAELTGDNEALIRFAREQYLMKKPDEDLFIVVEE